MPEKNALPTQSPLGDLSTEQFLKNYWQQKPLVIRQGMPNFTSPITADELAGLACEDDVHSRIVIEKGGDHPWQLINGPMQQDSFSRLPETHWTLLVNDVEKHLPDLAYLVDAFRFIPEWRVDDLMISYAPHGGSVGPHLDQYDVFILQAQGHRRWQINTKPVANDNQVEGTQLRIQKDFVAEQEWLLAPGDIIYIPPGVTHYGVATDDCLSFSIGFRAPTHSEMLADFIDFISRDLTEDKTYQDNNLSLQAHPNEITEDAIANLREIFHAYLNPEHPELSRWFGRFVSDNKTELIYENEEHYKDYAQLKQNHSVLMRNPASRFAFYRQEAKALLFIDGEETEVSNIFAENICRQREYNLNVMDLNPVEQQLVVRLFNAGQLLSASGIV